MHKQFNRKKIVLSALLILILILVILYFGIRVKKISVTGNVQNTPDEIISYVLGEDTTPSSAKLFLKNKFKEHKEIPFVEKYEIEYKTPTEIVITVYEKNMIGYYEYMGSNMYFDKDGIIVESSAKVIEGVPKITGLSFDYVILHEKLPVDNEKVFDRILQSTKLIKKFDIDAKKININKNDFSVTVYINKVEVNMGNDDMLSEKFSDLQGMVKLLEKKEGVLDMTEYKEDGNYILKKK